MKQKIEKTPKIRLQKVRRRGGGGSNTLEKGARKKWGGQRSPLMAVAGRSLPAVITLITNCLSGTCQEASTNPVWV